MIDGLTSNRVVLNIGTTDIVKYKGLIITPIKDEFYKMRGSLHKYSNDGLHNANDYTMSDYANTLNMLFDEFGLNANITEINGFEFGVNIKLPNTPDNTIKRLILHKQNAGYSDSQGKTFNYKNYALKVYDKSKGCEIEQYRKQNILRVEIKVKKMIYIKDKIYLRSVSDLLDVEVWKQFENLLIKTIKECLFVDFSDDEVNQLSVENKLKYKDYVNPTFFWKPLHVESRMKYRRELAKCETFIAEYSKSTLKSDIINLIADKCKELRNISKSNEVEKCYKFTTLSNSRTNDNVTNSPLLNSEFVTPTSEQLTRCKGCGKVIENPRKGQMYCSAKVVGYNQAHQCRNNNSNPRNNTKKSIRHLLLLTRMFDLEDTIAPEKRMYLH